jgi:hypothetical protein
MSIITDQLGNKATTLAQLIGILKPDGGVNLDWFSSAGSELEDIPRRLPQLFTLIQELLGPAVSEAPLVNGAQWYAIPDPADGRATGLYLIAPGPSEDISAGDVGIGVFHDLGYDDLSITTSVYIPLFHLSTSAGPSFIAGSQPIKLSVCAACGGNFTATNNVTFSALNLDTEIYFADELPTMQLVFKDLTINGVAAPTNLSTYNSLSELIGNLDGAIDWVAAVLLSANYWLNQYVGRSTYTIGDILEDTCIVKLDDTEGYVLNADYLRNNAGRPQTIAENFLLNLLTNLADSSTPVVPLAVGAPGSGIYVVKENAEANGSDFGFRLIIEDIPVTNNGSDGTGTGPQIQVQLGKWIAGEPDADSWVARSLDISSDFPSPGFSLFLFQSNSMGGECAAAPALNFAPHLELISVGIDIQGSGNKPLFEDNGYVLNETELRIYLKQNGTSFTFGAAASLDGLGIPLGTNLSANSNNPVAQNLLSSGPAGSAATAPDSGVVNPTFSVSVAWMSEHSNGLKFHLYAPGGTRTEKVWFPIQRAFGPLHCQRIGVEWPEANDDDLLSVLFDGGVAVGGLDIDLLGLSVGIPISAPGDLDRYRLDLEGIDITFSSGPLEISGGLYKEHVAVAGQDVLEYNGEALIKAENWSLAALGSWASFQGHPSLFIFAFLNDPLGGPPFFFVTGVSAGFGYNRSLKMPAQDQVQDFPFVAGLTDPSRIGGADAGPSEALAALGDWVQPAQGVNWAAAGIQFTSFELINSNALLVVEFGNHFEISLLGLSRIRLPQAGPVAYAYVELGLEVIIDPGDGFFLATAQVTPNSFVINPLCHLTGGFAFCIWFGENEHAGDFVLNVGGYHPLFDKPDWYPDEPRLGFAWQVSDHVTIRGDAYFALTPSCVMGGGALDVQFDDGDLHAWFTAHADFLIQWKPFYFLASVGVSVGVSYRMSLLFTHVTIRVELGADLDLWGPPTGGKVHVHLWCVSFTVSFGPDFGTGNDYLEWSDFRALLPQDSKHQQEQQPRQPMMRAMASSAATPPPADSLGNVCKISLNAGLVPNQNQSDRWLVRSDEFQFTVESTFPLTEVDLIGQSTTTRLPAPTLNPIDANAPAGARSSDGYYVGVRSMGINCTNSVLSITITDLSEAPHFKLDLDGDWLWQLKTRDVAKAVWGQSIDKAATPKPGAELLAARLVGLALVSPKIKVPAGPPAIAMTDLSYDPINETDDQYLPFPQAAETNEPQASDTSLQTISTTITKDSEPASPVANRAAIFGALAAFGYDAGTNGPLNALAANVNFNFPEAPMLGSPLGT